MKKLPAFPPAMALAYLLGVNNIARSNLIVTCNRTTVETIIDQLCILWNSIWRTAVNAAANNLNAA